MIYMINWFHNSRSKVRSRKIRNLLVLLLFVLVFWLFIYLFIWTTVVICHCS